MLRARNLPFPHEFTEGVVEFVQRQDELSECAFELTWLELVVLFDLHGSVPFPVPSTGSGRWVNVESQPFASSRLTLAAQLRIWRQTAISSFRALGLSVLFVSNLSLADLGYSMSLGGFRMGCDSSLRDQARGRWHGRRIVSAAGLSRPLA